MPGITVSDARDHQLLRTLPDGEVERLTGDLRWTRHHAAQIVHDAGLSVRDVVFPITGVYSLVAVVSDGSATEVSSIGDDGIVGMPMVLGNGRTINVRSIAQSPTRALAIDAATFRQRVRDLPRLAQLMGAYTAVLFSEAAQYVACNRLHSTEQRLARWLLNHDRRNHDYFPVTHEFIATMLGVRRASVSQAAMGLRSRGVIEYRRGNVQVLDRRALEQTACECYRIVQTVRTALLPASR